MRSEDEIRDRMNFVKGVLFATSNISDERGRSYEMNEDFQKELKFLEWVLQEDNQWVK